MDTTILLIRHGQTDWNVARRWQGHLDIPLNKEGINQARALAQRLESRQVSAIYSSDLKRAAMTADILGHALNLEPIYTPVWRERHVGDFAGLTNAEIQGKLPEAWKEMQKGLLNPPGGEKYVDLYQRVVRGFKQILEGHKDETVAIVSHGGALMTLISHVLGLGVDQYGRFSLAGNTGLSIVQVNDHGPRLTLLNDTCHLH